MSVLSEVLSGIKNLIIIIAIIYFFSGDKSSNYLIKFKIQIKQITIL